MVVFIVAIVLVWMNRQLIWDYAAASQYSPSNEVAALVTDTGMTSRGELYFYATHPVLSNTSEVSDACDSQDTDDLTLGCYVNNKIYVFNAKNSQIPEVEEVTAAHEMLHAAYARLSSSDKQHVNALLKTEAEKLQNDTAFADRMKPYADLDQQAYYDELHSVIGTEIADVPDQLEKHYETYFKDRQKVVKMYASYEAVFMQLKAKADALVAEIDALATSINNRAAAYKTAAASLTEEINAFNARANTQGAFSSVAEFTNARAALIAKSNSLDSERTSINNAISEYEQKRQEYEAAWGEFAALRNSIDSSLAPAPAVSE